MMATNRVRRGTAVPLRYHFLAYRKDQLWLPAAVWGLFALLVVIGVNDRPDQMGAAFLAFVLPLMAGILAASAVVDDPALELQFAAPQRARRIVLERLALLLGILGGAAISFQLFLSVVGVGLSAYGSLLARQTLWLAPSLFMLGLGSLAALASGGSVTGALLTGLIWLGEIFLRGQFYVSPWARYLFLFTGFFLPDAAFRPWAELCLSGLGVLLTALAWRMLERQERYL